MSSSAARLNERLARARAGDAGAIAWLHERYGERLLTRIRLMMGAEAHAVAESGDFLQGCLVELLQSPGDGAALDEDQLLRRATAIARNNIRDEVRRRRERALESLSASALRAGGAEPGPSPATRLVAREEVERLVDALERLRPEHRRVLELRDLEGLPFAEVGRRMERSEDAAQKLHTRAMIGLGRELGSAP